MVNQRSIRIVDIVDEDGLRRLPPCADPRFDHRSCDYWEDGVRGSKAARPAWWRIPTPTAPAETRPRGLTDNPFAPPVGAAAVNPFAPTPVAASLDPFGDDDEEPFDNPFAPPASLSASANRVEGPRKLSLLSRGLGIAGSYAKVLEWDGEPVVYAQFGPLSAYPRARQMRDLYPRLPQSPLPAVITCVATALAARGRDLRRILVMNICDDLAHRGFAAVEAYPDLTLDVNEASAAHPGFWMRSGFAIAIEDDRFPVLRRELG